MSTILHAVGNLSGLNIVSQFVALGHLIGELIDLRLVLLLHNSARAVHRLHPGKGARVLQSQFTQGRRSTIQQHGVAACTLQQSSFQKPFLSVM